MPGYVTTGTRTFPTTNAIAQFLRVKTAGALEVAGADDQELGVMFAPTYSGDTHGTVWLTNAPGTKLMIASGAITAGNTIYAAAGGKVAASGSVVVGKAITGTTANNDILEVLPAQSLDIPAAAGITTKAVTFNGSNTENQIVIPDDQAQALRWMVDGAAVLNVLTSSGDATYTWTGATTFASAVTLGVSAGGAGSTFVPLVPIAAQQDLTGPGAVTITQYYTAVTTESADALTLVDGAVKGQLKKIQLVDDGGDGTLTPENLTGGNTITFGDVGDYAILMWDGSSWVPIELGNDADGATAPAIA